MQRNPLRPAIQARAMVWLSAASVVAALLILSSRSALGAEANGPVVALSFDEARGRLLPDSSGHANHAVSRAARLVKGVVGRGLECDGESNMVGCPSAATLDCVDALSIEAWVRLAALPADAHSAVVRKEGAYALRFGGNSLAFILWFDGEPAYLYGAKKDWELDRWYHLVGTYDGASMRLFVDGKEDAASPRARTGAIDKTSAPCGLGSSRSMYRLDGVLDEVRVFGRALCEEEIQTSFARGRASLKAQRGVEVEPVDIGPIYPVLRKPRREITMVQDGFLWIDAEDFADYGGWWLDTQFVQLMGSGYLIAAGLGQPVADATVDVAVPKAGKYRVWVRAKNWLKDFAPGQFTILVGDVASKQTFGKADTEAWIWESAGEFDLAEGNTRLALRDRTGYYSRCDAVILTTDLDYTPPAKTEDIRKERARLTGLSLKPQHMGHFDVVVVGAGSAGSCAALAAARTGARTALIQNRPVLGGNASIELGVPICGAAVAHANARESGVIGEATRIRVRYGHTKMSEPLQMLADEEENLSIFFNRHVFEAEMEGPSRIRAVKAVDTLTGAVTTCSGDVFVDCSGDGWLGYFAGAEYRLGRESRHEFNESLAPEKPDKITMSGCLMGKALSYRAEDTGRLAPYTPPAWASKLPPADQIGRKPRGFAGGQWWLEHPGTFDDVWEAERARDELIRISYGYWDYIKNHSPYQEAAARYALVHVPIMDAKRESRRLVGDYILTQNDVQNAVPFPDRIAYGGWSLDVHHPLGIFSGLEGPFDFDPRVPLYTIPFRTLYSVNIDNLLFAGRNMSVTHVALGTVRVQGTLAIVGQAAGTAAAMCAERRTTPRELWHSHIADLQQTLLKQDQYIPGIKNEDPQDLARQATVSASSAASYDLFERGELTLSRVHKGDLHPMTTTRAMMFPRGVNKRLGSVLLYLASTNSEPTKLTVHVRQSGAPRDFSATEDITAVEVDVPPGKEGWLRVPVNCTIEKPCAWVWLEPAEGIFWRLMTGGPAGSCRAYSGGRERAWTVMKGQQYALQTEPPLAIANDYGPENAVNGFARMVGDQTNMWASDPEQPLPQWLQLNFDKPVDLNTVYLTFDTDMTPRHRQTPPMPQQCVRDYELAYLDGGQWKTVAEVRGNFQRHRVHRFPKVTTGAVRLTVRATNGDSTARLFEIRAYCE